MNQKQMADFQSFLSARDYPGALDYLSELETEFPQNPVFVYQKGFVRRLTGDLDAAAADYERAIKMDATFAPAFQGLGIVRQLQQQWEAAVSALQEAIRLEPKSASAWNSLGLTYKKAGRIKEALDSYGRAQETLVDAAFHQYRNRPDFLTKGETESGERLLVVGDRFFPLVREALRSELTYAIVMNNIGQCYVEIGDPKRARDAFLESIDFIPDGSSYRDPFDNLAAIDQI